MSAPQAGWGSMDDASTPFGSDVRRVSVSPAPAALDVRPAPVGPTAAVRAHLLVAILPVLLLVLPALGWALLRTPVYKAESRLVVGDLGFTAQAVPGYVLASQQMAETYSRLASSGTVVGTVARQLGLPVDTVRLALTATAIPESAIVVINAHTVDRSVGVRIVQTAADALVSLTTSTDAGSDQILAEYGRAVTDEQTRQADVTGAQRAYSAAHQKDPTDTSAESRQALNRLAAAQAAYEQAKLRADSLASAYQQGLQGSVLSGAKARVVSPGITLGDDRTSRLELAVISALLVGGVIGTAAATVMANTWLTRRSPTV